MENLNQNALLMFSDKSNIASFATELISLNYTLYGSQGTARALIEAGIPCIDVATLVGDPLINHKVVSLSREIHAGLLAETIEEIKEIKDKGILKFDLVCIDFYPLEEAINAPNATPTSVRAKTDIGGPTAASSAVKGLCPTIIEVSQRPVLLQWLKDGKPEEEKFLQQLEAHVNFIVSRYRGLSAQYLDTDKNYLVIHGTKVKECKYGENKWQTPAVLFTTSNKDPLAIQNFKIIDGTEPSHNNYCDIDRMLQTITHIAAGFKRNFEKVPYIAVVVKHGNPCGVAVGTSQINVIQNMIKGDLTAIHGGSIMTNFPIDSELAHLLVSYKSENSKRILDTVTAPSVSEESIKILSRKQGKCRIMVNEVLNNLDETTLDSAERRRYVRGGILTQPNYSFIYTLDNPDLKIYPASDEAMSILSSDDQGMEIKMNMILAWAVGSTSTSNTITIVKNGMLIGNGVGQQDRVGSAELAVKKAGARALNGSVAYSDSFFPFADGPEVLARSGIRWIIGTSGSMNDKEVISCCNSLGVTVILLTDTGARGFYGH